MSEERIQFFCPVCGDTIPTLYSYAKNVQYEFKCVKCIARGLIKILPERD